MFDTTLTYQDLYDIAIDKVISKCGNISEASYNGIPAYYKRGYSYMQATGRARLTWNIIESTAVDYYSEGLVRADFNEVISKFQITDKLSSKLTPSGVIQFYKAFSLFCSYRVMICASQLSPSKSDRLIIYSPRLEIDYSELSRDSYRINTEDAMNITENIIDIISKVTRVYPVRYTSTLTNI